MNFQEKLKQIRELVGLDENVKSLLEKMTGKELVSYEGIDALVAALMGFYNNELNKKINKIDNIAELQSRKNLKVGDIVEVLGYYTAGDGATHKRVITNKDDDSGVQLANGLWANVIKPVIFYYSNFEELKQSSIFVGAKAVVYGLVFDIKKQVMLVLKMNSI